MPLPEALKIATQIAEALANAHAAHIIHRDLKPAKVMVQDDGRVKVLDFGLAKLVEPQNTAAVPTATQTAAGMIVGFGCPLPFAVVRLACTSSRRSIPTERRRCAISTSQTRRITEILTLNKPPDLGLAVSPDRRSLLFPNDAAVHYAEIRADLKKRGAMIGASDLFIAAHARARGLTLVTNNTAEFGRVHGLSLENWIAPARRRR